MTTYLITGATGTIGSAVVASLSKQGATIRVGLRDPGKGAALAAQGAEVVALDYDRPDTLTSAFAGVDRVFLLTPFVEHFLPQVEAAVGAAKAAGVSFILRLSALGANPDSPDGLSGQHGKAENLVKNSGIAWAVIQPTFFQDNLLNFMGQAIQQQSAYYGASRGGKVAHVSSADIGAAAAEILANPAPHTGKTYVLTGPEALTDEEVAALVSRVVGRAVRYVDLAPDDYLGSMKAQGLPDWMAEHIVMLENVKANGWAAAVSPAVAEILGRQPESYAAFIERNRARLS